MAGKNKVHVFSVIPRLASMVREKLPDVDVVEVKLSGSVAEKYDKDVTEDEVESMQEAEILLVDNNLLAQMVHRLPKLQWAQGTWAGVEGLINALKDKPKPTYPVTRLVGDAFSQLMAEYVIGWIISHERGWLEARQNQLQSKWLHDGNIAYYRSIRDVTVGIMGMGHIGKEVAQALKFFNACVNAFTRTAPSEENRCKHVDKYWHTGNLSGFLQESDYIINIMPSTPVTRGMLSGDVLKDAKKGAVFINIGRGDVIDEGDIIKALNVGWISAAILDVFSKEPLPSDSPLWQHPKVLITPHSAGVSRSVDCASAFVSNYRRYVEGLPLLYVIDWNSGY